MQENIILAADTFWYIDAVSYFESDASCFTLYVYIVDVTSGPDFAEVWTLWAFSILRLNPMLFSVLFAQRVLILNMLSRFHPLGYLTLNLRGLFTVLHAKYQENASIIAWFFCTLSDYTKQTRISYHYYSAQPASDHYYVVNTVWWESGCGDLDCSSTKMCSAIICATYNDSKTLIYVIVTVC